MFWETRAQSSDTLLCAVHVNDSKSDHGSGLWSILSFDLSDCLADWSKRAQFNQSVGLKLPLLAVYISSEWERASLPFWADVHPVDTKKETSTFCDWIIDRRGAVVLPLDWAIDSWRGFALGFDWPGSRGLPLEELPSVSSDVMRAESTPLQSPSFLSVALHIVKTTLSIFLDNIRQTGCEVWPLQTNIHHELFL